MSLRFYFGPSDGALSKKIYQDVIERSLDKPEQNFLIIVPDQFTMQTQKEISELHPRGGLINIDVLSFGRLGHRVLEEVDCREIPVLDDVGKCLVLQKVAEGLEEELPVLGSSLRKQGYLREVKSAISEFMQYGLSPKDVEELVSFAGEKKALAGKLRDLGVIYEKFKEYIQDHFVTAEETLDVLRRNLSKSKLLRGSVVVLDGYTGFTPIQYRVLQEMATLCDEMILTLVCGEEDSPYRLDGEQKLFYLTKKTVNDLERLAAEVNVERDRREDVFLPDEKKDGELAFLRKHFFRYDLHKYRGDVHEISIAETLNPAGEVHYVATEIQRLIRGGEVSYRDVVLVSGDLESYAPYVESEFARLGIPCFIDRTRSITLNPMTEFMLSALNLPLKNYSYEAVFHYLRSGLAGIPEDEVDRLENYVIEMGIRGKKAWQERFARKTKAMNRRDPKDEAPLEALNRTRETFASQVTDLNEKRKGKASEYVDRLYDFLVEAQAERKLSELAKRFEARGDLARAKEYTQIYRLVMDLLNQIYQLLGEEEVTLQEFVDILTGGLAEIQVGLIPQSVDRVLVGDVERTRFKPVKVLFFLGVNDGNIPRNTSKGGIISDVEREFLKESDHALAPTPRQQAFIQRFYLYLNVTKPKEKLYFSYSRQGSDGKTLRPAYLIDTLKRTFPDLALQVAMDQTKVGDVLTRDEGRRLLAQSLRDYAGGLLPKEREQDFYVLYAAFDGEMTAKDREHYQNAAFLRHEDGTLLREIARLVYGEILENSVSRLETYASCAYRHFLKYGLSLKEREEFSFEAVDLGNVYHGVLERFSKCLEQENKTWFDFEEEFARSKVREAMEQVSKEYGGSVLYANERNRYQVTRMERILVRTVLTMQKQLKKGAFVPKEYEVSFHQITDLKEVGLSGQEKMKLIGKIDRVDLAEDERNVYVKIMDYKSGDKDFDLVALYHGLQLQLVVYVNAALERVRKKHPGKDVVPAALLYYHVEDPMVEGKQDIGEEELGQMLERALRTKGVVNDDPEVVRLLDGIFTDKSDAIPVERKKDGTYGARSKIMSRENLEKVSRFVNHKLAALGKEILEGNVALNPYERGDETSCKYCPYGKVCGFDKAIPGCEKRVLKETAEEILPLIEKEIGKEGGEEPESATRKEGSKEGSGS